MLACAERSHSREREREEGRRKRGEEERERERDSKESECTFLQIFEQPLDEDARETQLFSAWDTLMALAVQDHEEEHMLSYEMGPITRDR